MLFSHVKLTTITIVLSSLTFSPMVNAATTTSNGSLAHQKSNMASLRVDEQRQILIRTAETQLNVPYVWGKQELFVGFDCSNFIAWSYRAALGIDFSGSSVWQRHNEGSPVSLSNIQPGDLLFFKTAKDATGVGHVGIYIGDGKVIQDGGGWKKVVIEPLKGTWLNKNLVFARRVIG